MLTILLTDELTLVLFSISEAIGIFRLLVAKFIGSDR
jgi:hypothetical protein